MARVLLEIDSRDPSSGDVPTYNSSSGQWEPSAGGGGLALSQVEVNLGSVARRSGKFSISGTGLVVGKPVYIQQAVGPYTGKGTRADESEVDQVNISAKVVSSTSIQCYWTSKTKVWKNFKFNYLVGS